MIVYRLSKSVFSNDLSGKGAELTGGRWNSKGIPMIYTGESRALCTAELAVHLPFGILPSGYVILSIEIPDTILIQTLDLSQLPNDWQTYPHSHCTQLIGDQFVSERKYLVLKVPSVVVPGDFNYLINPGHQELSKTKIIGTKLFRFDKRLFVK